MTILARLESVYANHVPDMINRIKETYYSEIKLLKSNLKESRKYIFTHYSQHGLKRHIEIIDNILRILNCYHFNIVYFVGGLTEKEYKKKLEKVDKEIKKYTELRNEYLERTKVVYGKPLDIYIWFTKDSSLNFRVNKFWTQDKKHFNLFKTEVRKTLTNLNKEHPGINFDWLDFGHRKTIRTINILYLTANTRNIDDKVKIVSVIKNHLEKVRKEYETANHSE